MTVKNPHAVALGKRTSPRKAAASQANGAAGGRPPKGVSRALWRQVRAKAAAEGVSMPALYQAWALAYLDDD